MYVFTHSVGAGALLWHTDQKVESEGSSSSSVQSISPPPDKFSRNSSTSSQKKRKYNASSPVLGMGGHHRITHMSASRRSLANALPGGARSEWNNIEIQMSELKPSSLSTPFSSVEGKEEDTDMSFTSGSRREAGSAPNFNFATSYTNSVSNRQGDSTVSEPIHHVNNSSGVTNLKSVVFADNNNGSLDTPSALFRRTEPFSGFSSAAQSPMTATTSVVSAHRTPTHSSPLIAHDALTPRSDDDCTHSVNGNGTSVQMPGNPYLRNQRVPISRATPEANRTVSFALDVDFDKRTRQ